MSCARLQVIRTRPGWTLPLAVALATVPLPLRGQTIEIVDGPVVLEGRLPIQGNTLRRSMRLSVMGAGGNATLSILPEDLKSGDPTRLIDRRNVTLQGVTEVRDGALNVTVEVQGIEAPGTYTGTFEVLLRTSDSVADSDTASLEVTVLPRADLRAVVPDSAYRRVNCPSWLSCWWARTLVHRRIDADSIRLHLEHTAQASLKVRSEQLILVGEKSGEAFRLDSVKLEATTVPPAGATVAYPLHRGTLPPDHYAGQLSMTLDSVVRPVASDFRIDVRSGPILPTLLLFLGIFISRGLVVINSSPDKPEHKGEINSTSDKPEDQARGNGKAESHRVRAFFGRLSGFRWNEKPPNFLARVLSWSSGVPWSDHDRWEGYLRGLGVLVFLLAALMEGMGKLYVDNPTFGDTVLVDYATIFLLPFTADIVSRTLGNWLWPTQFRVRISPHIVGINEGKSVELNVEVRGGPSGSASWSCWSSDTNVVTVQDTNAGCTVTGVAPGKETITAEVTKGGETKSATAEVTVH